MRLILISLVLVWGASLAMVLCAFLATWLTEWRGSVMAREPATVHEDAIGRALTLDAGLLVPWTGLRASKERLGVDESVFRAAEVDVEPEAHPDAPKEPDGAPSGSGSDSRAA